MAALGGVTVPAPASTSAGAGVGSSLGGVSTAASGAASSASSAASSASASATSFASSSVGGTSTGSALNQGLTGKETLKIALQATATVETKLVSLAPKFITVPKKVLTNQYLADWYRNGNLIATEEAPSRNPLTLVPFKEELATIRVFGLQKNGEDKELLPAYTKFILEDVQEQRSERAQVVETFGDFYVFFFGSRPSTYNYSGTLINAKNANWVSDFEFYYENYLRGSRLVDNNARIIMTYGGRMVEGFMLNFNTSTNAIVENGVKVSFQIIITSRKFLGFSEDFGFIIEDGKTKLDKKFADLIKQVAGPEGTGLSEPAVSTASGQANSAVNGGAAAGPLSSPFPGGSLVA